MITYISIPSLYKYKGVNLIENRDIQINNLNGYMHHYMTKLKEKISRHKIKYINYNDLLSLT